MSIKTAKVLGRIIGRWAIVILLVLWTYDSLFPSSGMAWSISGATYIYLAALFGVSSIASRHEREFLSVAYQSFLIGMLSHLALSRVQVVFRTTTIGLAAAACIAFVALTFFLLSLPSLRATSPSTGSQRELAVRIYWAAFGALLVAIPVGGALPYVVLESGTPGAAARVGWSPYGYALLFVAVFSVTLAILLVPPVKSLPRPELEGWRKYLPWAVLAFLALAALEDYLARRSWVVFFMSLVAFAGVCVAIYRAFQFVSCAPKGQVAASPCAPDVPVTRQPTGHST